MRNPKPTVTAETPSGSASAPSSTRVTVAGDGDRGRAADDDGDGRRRERVEQRVADRFGRRDEQDAAGMQFAERAVRVEAEAARCVERTEHEHPDRRAEQYRHREQGAADEDAFSQRARSVGGLVGRP